MCSMNIPYSYLLMGVLSEFTAIVAATRCAGASCATADSENQIPYIATDANVIRTPETRVCRIAFLITTGVFRPDGDYPTVFPQLRQIGKLQRDAITMLVCCRWSGYTGNFSLRSNALKAASSIKLASIGSCAIDNRPISRGASTASQPATRRISRRRRSYGSHNGNLMPGLSSGATKSARSRWQNE